ncbi:MAG: HlyD family secretion protein [Syntrophales bacterium]|nr:HlyD family secretion protein [Syntrophales bacterium]
MGEMQKSAGKNNKKGTALVIFLVIGLIVAAAVFFYLQYKKIHITTDDAFIDGKVHTIASKVSGTVKAIHVDDNQFVKADRLLVEIDPRDYDVRVNEAQFGLKAEEDRYAEVVAGIEAARRQLEERGASVKAAKAELELQEATMLQARKDITRAESLFKQDAISKERYENAQTGYKIAQARVKVAQEQLRRAQSALETQKAIIVQAEKTLRFQSSLVNQRKAAVETVRLNAGYTKIYAPTDGYITKKSVERGNQIQPAQPLMALVPLSDIWVTANYKETDIRKVKPGQDVEIKVDTYPGKKFRGRVQSIMAGTGAVFSLFPPENATGSYVKVVQRIPVKIVLNKGEDREHILRIGMSVVPTITIR